MIDIKDIQGSAFFSVSINKGAKCKFELMKEDYITLPFSVDSPIDFALGSNIEVDGRLYEIVELQKPSINNTTGGFDYQLRFDAYYWKWKNKIFKYTPEVGGQEASWSLTASLDVHLGIFLRNLEALGYTYRGIGFEFAIDNSVENKAMSMTYENTNMIDALSAMAESWSCEWWVTDNIIHFGRCEHGTPVRLEFGDNVVEMTRSESQSQYATRLYVFGSTRNLPTNYRPIDEGVVVNGIVQRRLMLPEGTPYIDAYAGMSEEEAIEEVVILEDVYPKVDGNISSVETYQDSVENEDGTTTTEIFYRFKDDGFTFSNDFILEGQELKVKFTSGSLNGMEFGLVFNPNGEDESKAEAQLFEVVVNEDYGRKLPDATLYPEVGNKYVLLNWDSTKIADLGLVSKAEELLYQEGLKLSAKRKIDPNTYGCKMFSDYMYGLDNNGNQNPSYSKQFEVGDRVNLVNPAYFPNGRESRIIGYEYNLDYPFDSPVYTVGETSSYSRLGALEEKIETLSYKGVTYTGGGGSSVYIITSNDTTKATNKNVYSALRSDQNYISKQKDDSTQHNLGVGKDLTVGGNFLHKEFASGTEKGGYAIRKNSEEHYEVESDNIIARILAKTYDLLVQNHATFVGDLSSEEFISGFMGGKGWSIRTKEILNAEGINEKKSVAEFDDLIVRGSMRIYEFIVSQLLGENDNRIFTGMMEVDHYDANDGKVYLKTDNGRLYNPFRVDDVIIVQQYGGNHSQESGYYVTKQYEFIVTEVGVGEQGEDRLDWVTFRNFTTSMEGGNEELITEHDTLVRIDNISDANRKGIIQLMSVGEDTPYMDFIYGAKTDPENSLKGRLGNLGGVYNPLFGWLKEFGAYLTNLYAVGEFVIAHTGENVSDSIEIAKGQFRTNYRQTTFDMSEEQNFFTNASMTNNCEHWVLGSEATEYFMVDELPQFFNFDLYASEQTYAGLSEWKGRDMLRLSNSSIMQSNSLIDKAGTHKVYTGSTENADGSYTDTYEEVVDTLYLSVRFFVSISGKLEFGFVENGNFIDNSFHYSSNVTAREDGYEVKLSGIWDGKGDFTITSTGDVYVDLLSLTDKPLDNFKITTETKIEQDATRISLLGKKINGIEGSVTDLGIELNAAEERITAYVNKEIQGVETSVSQLQISVGEISATVEKISFDNNGNITNINKSGLVLESNYASLFSTQVNSQGIAKEAEIKAYVDEEISGIKISADQINISANDYISIINKGTTTINAARLDLSGLVTVTSLNTTLAGYATDSELSAAQSALNTSISDLNTTLSAQINAKASTESLNAKVSELNTAINKKADTSSLGSVAYMNDIANAACNGSTLIVGGYINANLLKVEKIYATEGTIGDFSISETTLSVEGSYTSANLLGTNNYSTTIEADRFAVNVNGGEFSSSFGLNGAYALETTSWYLAAMSVYSGGASRRSDNVCAIHATLDKSDIGLYINGGSSYLKASSGKTISINGLSLLATRSFSGTADTNMDILIVSGTAKLPSASSCQGKMYFTKILSGSLTVQNVYKSDSSGVTSSGTWTDANARLFFSDGTYWHEINGV